MRLWQLLVRAVVVATFAAGLVMAADNRWFGRPVVSDPAALPLVLGALGVLVLAFAFLVPTSPIRKARPERRRDARRR